jgi:hypothetical protein
MEDTSISFFFCHEQFPPGHFINEKKRMIKNKRKKLAGRDDQEKKLEKKDKEE